LEFVEYIRDNDIKHAGVIFIHTSMTDAEKESFAEVATIIVLSACGDSSHGFRNRIIYPGPNGVRVHELRKGHRLVFSYDWMRDVFGLTPEADLPKGASGKRRRGSQ